MNSFLWFPISCFFRWTNSASLIFFLNYCWKQILAGLGTIAIWYFMSTTFPYQCWNVVFLFITALIFIYKHIYRGMWHTWFTLGYLLHLSVLWCCLRISLGAGSPNQLDDCIFCIFWFISYFTSLHNQFCSVLFWGLTSRNNSPVHTSQNAKMHFYTCIKFVATNIFHCVQSYLVL